jgi:hypothetical protein
MFTVTHLLLGFGVAFLGSIWGQYYALYLCKYKGVLRVGGELSCSQFISRYTTSDYINGGLLGCLLGFVLLLTPFSGPH